MWIKKLLLIVLLLLPLQSRADEILQDVDKDTTPVLMERLRKTSRDTESDIATNVTAIAANTAAIAALTSDEIIDADSDTKVQVEEGADDDTIRFDCANTEQMALTDGQLEPTTTSDVFLGSSTKQFKFIIENRINDTGCTETGRIWFRTDI